MKNTIIIGLIAIILLFAIGCAQQKYPDAGPKVEVSENIPVDETGAQQEETQETPDPNINPITKEPYYDIEEKRGYKTNITDFKELVRRASTIQSYKYNITDPGVTDKEYQFYVLGRFIKVGLPEQKKHKTGQVYDEIFMDRVTKTAFSHCSYRICPKPNLDKELEKVDYADYYINDPMEYLYKATNDKYVEEQMLGDQTTKVFNVKFEGKPAKIWLQEYYGFPIKIEVDNLDGTKRNIIFENMMVDATRRGEIDLPFNFTVSGEGDKHWIFWEHYLGEWPKKGQTLTPEMKAMLGL
jgi:hypothetical protein